jgi:hypothetical protein
MRSEKRLILCEGACEKLLLERCLDEGLLSFAYDDLLYGLLFHKRQFDPELIVQVHQASSYQIRIMRVGDTINEKLKIPAEVKSQLILPVVDYHTRPEIEILFIIDRGWYDDFCEQNAKEKLNPKAFMRRAAKDYDFANELKSVTDLAGLLKKYKQLKKLKPNEHCLADLLKE